MSCQKVLKSGSIHLLRDIVRQHGCRNIFLVTGKASYSVCGAEDALAKMLAAYRWTRFYDFGPNVYLEDLKKGLTLFKEDNYDCIISVGGGSVLDMAKLIKGLAQQKGNIIDSIENNQIDVPSKCPLIALPTTAGSGSEATHFAGVFVREKRFSVSHSCLRPNVVVIDPDLLKSLDKRVEAASAMDFFCQAIESYWSIHATKMSKHKARRAIKVFFDCLHGGLDLTSSSMRSMLSQGANLAGEAINITMTTAAHAISYPLTYHYHIPHGHAVGLLLPSILMYNSDVSEKDVLDPRGYNYVSKTLGELIDLLGADNPASAKDKLVSITKQLGLSRDLPSFGIRTHRDIELVVREAFNPQRIQNNPRRMSAEEVRRILLNL